MSDSGNKLQYRAAVALVAVVSLVPRRLMQLVGRGLGRLSYHLWTERRLIALSNLDLAFGDTKSTEEKVRIAKRCFQNIGSCLLELLWSKRVTKERLFQIVEVDDKEVEMVRNAYALNRGVIFLPAHYGNWEIMAVSYGFLGFNAHFVAKRLKNPYLDDLANGLRCRAGNKVVYMNGATKEIQQLLESGEGIATLIDQKVPVQWGGILLDFFGHPAPTTSLLAELALKTGAPIISTRCHPLKGGRCRLVLGPEIEFEASGNFDRDVHDLTQKCLSHIESYIREDPEFWIWGHKRWKLD